MLPSLGCVTCPPEAEHPVRKTIVSQGVHTERANLISFHFIFCISSWNKKSNPNTELKSVQEIEKKLFGQNIG